MEENIHEQVKQALRHFRLPEYEEITDVGLYLDQATRYINEYMFPLSEDMAITSSMISNYVKAHLIPSPEHKLYSRSQIASLMCITMVKTIMSMDNIYLLTHMHDTSFSGEKAYELFRTELNRALQYVFGIAETLPDGYAQQSGSEYELLIQKLNIAIAHKIYLDMCFTAIEKSGAVELPQKKNRRKKNTSKKGEQPLPD